MNMFRLLLIIPFFSVGFSHVQAYDISAELSSLITSAQSVVKNVNKETITKAVAGMQKSLGDAVTKAKNNFGNGFDTLCTFLKDNYKKGIDSLAALHAKYGSSFIELTQKHPQAYLMAQGAVGLVAIGGIIYVIYKSGIVKKLAEVVNPLSLLSPKKMIITATGTAAISCLIGAGLYFCNAAPENQTFKCTIAPEGALPFEPNDFFNSLNSFFESINPFKK